MSNLWQLITNNPQIVFFFAIILFSVLGSAGKKFAEAKQKREIQHERQRREQEAMRTGRPVEDPQAEQAAEVEARKQRLAEMQQRREAQLEELRKRRQLMLQRQQARQQAGGAGGGQGGVSQSGAAQSPGQSNPQAQPQPQARVTPSQPRPTPSRATPTPRPSRTSRPTPTVSGTHPSSHPVAVARGMSGPSIAAHDDHPTLHESSTLSGLRDRHLVNKLGGDSIAEKTVSALAVNTMLTTRNDLRKAIIMSELLAKPVALRSQHDPWLD